MGQKVTLTVAMQHKAFPAQTPIWRASKLVCYLTKYQENLKTLGASSPCNPNLGTRWGKVVRFTPHNVITRILPSAIIV